MDAYDVQVVLGGDASDCDIVLGMTHVRDVITVSLASQLSMCYRNLAVSKCKSPPWDHQTMIKRTDTLSPGSKGKHKTQKGCNSIDTSTTRNSCLTTVHRAFDLR